MSVMKESIELDAKALHDRCEAHGVFLDALRGAFNVAELRPIGDVVVVHRRTPAEDVVADEEVVEDGHGDKHHRDAEKSDELREELLQRDAVRRRQGGLDHVVEAAEPFVDHYVELDLKPDDEKDHEGNDDRPPEPAVRRQLRPDGREYRAADDHVLVKPDVDRAGLRGGEYHLLRLVDVVYRWRRIGIANQRSRDSASRRGLWQSRTTAPCRPRSRRWRTGRTAKVWEKTKQT